MTRGHRVGGVALSEIPLNRVPFLDLLRGVAILLMVLDHVVVVFGWPEEIRLLTRPALPLFMVVSGYLFVRLGPRYMDVLSVALVTWPAVVFLGVAWVHVLAVYALVLPLLVLPLGWRVLVGSLGLVQAIAWPLGWGGYEPGYVFAFLVLGNLLAAHPVEWPEWRSPVLEWAGRYPLAIYAGHLWLLVPVGIIGKM